MIRLGLCSVTFRKLAPAAILTLARRASLDAIEWGGDIHVPHGDVKTARIVRRMTDDEGLEISSYGSYYRVGQDPERFEDVLASAVMLGAPVIRVWAGTVRSPEAARATWDSVVADTRRIATLAQADGLRIAFEYHDNTLTDTDEATIQLLTDVNHAAVRCYWQMRESAASLAEHLEGLHSVLPWLEHVHVQASQAGQRTPLETRADAWRKILKVVASTGREHTAMLEFVRDDSPEQFLADAATLQSLRGDTL